MMIFTPNVMKYGEVCETAQLSFLQITFTEFSQIYLEKFYYIRDQYCNIGLKRCCEVLNQMSTDMNSEIQMMQIHLYIGWTIYITQSNILKKFFGGDMIFIVIKLLSFALS